jgi:hypothetical protein
MGGRPGSEERGCEVSNETITPNGGFCAYCAATGHDDNPCPQRLIDADRAVAGFVYRKSVNLDPDYRTIDMDLKKDLTDPIKRLCSPAKLTGVEAAAADVMEQRWVGVMVPDRGIIMQRVRTAMAARQAMGREHYGMTLQDHPAPIKERIRHLWEEALDGLAYSQWIWDGWMRMHSGHADFYATDSAGRVATECLKLCSQAIVELDRLMRTLGMDPVRKEGQP